MIIARPNPGQPLDLQYISDIAQSIIELDGRVKQRNFSSSILQNQDGKLEVFTTDLAFVAAYTQPITNKSIEPGGLENFVFKFEPSFNQTPIVTITPVNIGGTTTGQDITVVIKSVNAGEVTGAIKFNNTTTGTATVGINVIAIGSKATVSTSS